MASTLLASSVTTWLSLEGSVKKYTNNFLSVSSEDWLEGPVCGWGCRCGQRERDIISHRMACSIPGTDNRYTDRPTRDYISGQAYVNSYAGISLDRAVGSSAGVEWPLVAMTEAVQRLMVFPREAWKKKFKPTFQWPGNCSRSISLH